MATEHPITPPPELLDQWAAEYWGDSNDGVANGEKHIATQAARWAADTELEACCEWISLWCSKWPDGTQPEGRLRAARRPKPLSLKEQALAALKRQSTRSIPSLVATEDCDTIRRALEALPNDKH